ncbi:MAG: helix-turn-helix transcriptional regulator [Bacteroidales bacterium]|nr:helix-turn-helix transcriptional regulator [Bacteroidales bacterium]
MENTLYIKNMVCPRCVAAVDNFLKSNNFNVLSVELGKAVIDKEINSKEKDIIAKGLTDLGFELLDDRKTKTVERIKNAVVEFVHYQEDNLNQNLSDYIVSKLHSDYSSLSKMFSEQENITIEKYFIAQKTEKVKELLSYGELTLNEIAFKLNYSSAAYLSAQFKQVTGMTPSQYKASKSKDRKFLDSI